MNKVFEKVKKFVDEHPIITNVITTGIVSGITGAICYGLGRNDISNVEVALDHVPHPSTGAPVPVFGNMVDLSERTDFCKNINVRHLYDVDENVTITIGTKNNVDKYKYWWTKNVEPNAQKAWDEEYENGLRKMSKYNDLKEMLEQIANEEKENG